MIWQFIGFSLSSAVVAVALGKGVDWLFEKWRSQKLREDKLYKPLKFYLMLLENIDQNRESLFQEMKKGAEEIQFQNQEAKNNWQMETNRQLVNMNKPIVEEMLSHTDKIKSLFESNPESVEDNHWNSIRKFFDGVMKRKILIAGGHPQDFLHISNKAYKEWPDTIFESIKDLRKEINK